MKQNDSKELFRVVGNVQNLKSAVIYPPGKSDKENAIEFMEGYDEKVETIRTKLDAQALAAEQLQNHDQTEPTCEDTEPENVNDFDKFSPLDQEQVKKLVFKASNKFCDLDPMPTYIIRDCIDEILPLLTKIINTSLSLGEMPSKLKTAIIKPLLKKLGLELIKKNYRPVSNLAFLGKLIERAVAIQLVDHVTANNLMDNFQSAYKMYHSTETALLRVQSDILTEIDNQNVVLLVLLDLSAAFDTIDHGILLKRLAKKCKIKGTVLSWIKSYLTDRKQKVKIGKETSDEEDIKYGVPQGSVLGPILFTIYMSPLGKIMERHGIQYHIYADDTQLYIAFSPSENNTQKLTKEKLEECIKSVKDFLLINKMKLNDDKTEFLIIGTRQQLAKMNYDEIKVGDTLIKCADSAKNLGVIFDKNMGINKHISNTCRKGFYHIRNIAKIRNYLDQKSTETVIHAFVTSILDYGNSLLYGINANHMQKLQRVQNAAVRVVLKLKKFDHITEGRKTLHWLPVQARLEFKILALTWKCLHDKAPSYLKELIKIKHNLRVTRSNNSIILIDPKTNFVTGGDIAFRKAAPKMWNKLPDKIRNAETYETLKKTSEKTLIQFFLQNNRLDINTGSPYSKR